MFNVRSFSLLLSVLLCVLLSGCKDKNNQKEELLRSVKTMTLTSTSATGSRQLAGVLKPSDESDLSFQVSGTVDSVEVKLGDSVKKGQLLAAMDPRDFELKLQSAEAALNSAKAELSAAAEELKRQIILKEGKFSSQSNFEKAQSQNESAISKEKISISRVEEATRDLNRTKLLAPFDGKISLRAIEPYQETQTGRVVLKIQSAEGLKVEIPVPESLIREVSPKQVVKIDFPTLKGIQVSGVVREIGAQSDVGNAFPVTVDLDQTTADLRAGMSALVTFDRPSATSEPIYLIPLTAIDTRPQDTDQKLDKPDKILSVFLFDKETSQVKKNKVTVRDIQGNLIEVTKGLKEGDVLVTAGVPYLEDTQKVTQWKPKYRSPETDR